MLEAYALGVAPRQPQPAAHAAASCDLQQEDVIMPTPAWCCVPAISLRRQQRVADSSDSGADADATVHIIGSGRRSIRPAVNDNAFLVRRCLSFLVGGMAFAMWRPCTVPGAAGVQIRRGV